MPSDVQSTQSLATISSYGCIVQQPEPILCPFPCHSLLSLPTIRIAASPSTRTHQPSPPLVPKPVFSSSSKSATAASGHSFLANVRTSLSKLPGCSQTALMPACFASASTFRVTAGGVIIDKAVSEAGVSNLLSDATAGRGSRLTREENVMLLQDGFIGVTGRWCSRYHTRTTRKISHGSNHS